MALKDALKAPPSQKQMNVIAKWREKQDAETRDLFDAAIENTDEWTTAALQRVLCDNGFEITHQTVARYRDRALRSVAQ